MLSTTKCNNTKERNNMKERNNTKECNKYERQLYERT